MAKDTKDIATQEDAAAIDAMMAEWNKQDAGKAYDLALTRLKLGGVEANYFVDGGLNQYKTVTGVIMVARKARAYYAEAYRAGEHNPPDCASQNMETGSVPSNGVFGGQCSKCVQNQWGTSQTGKGKACREVRLLGLQSEEVGPCLLRLAPTSLKAFNELGSQAEGRSRSYSAFRTEISLAVEGGVSRAHFRVLEDFKDTRNIVMLKAIDREREAWIAHVEGLTPEEVFEDIPEETGETSF